MVSTCSQSGVAIRTGARAHPHQCARRYLSIYLVGMLPVADLIPTVEWSCKLSGPGQHAASSFEAVQSRRPVRKAARLSGSLSGKLPSFQEAWLESCPAFWRAVKKVARLAGSLSGGLQDSRGACQEGWQPVRRPVRRAARLPRRL